VTLLLIQSHRDLHVWQEAFRLAQRIFDLTRHFPAEERYSLTDQVRRSSRSVAANLAEAWIKRRYKAAFLLKLNDAMAEAAETQTWLEIAHGCGYLDGPSFETPYTDCNNVIGKLVNMSRRADDWLLKAGS